MPIAFRRRQPARRNLIRRAHLSSDTGPSVLHSIGPANENATSPTRRKSAQRQAENGRSSWHRNHHRAAGRCDSASDAFAGSVSGATATTASWPISTATAGRNAGEIRRWPKSARHSPSTLPATSTWEPSSITESTTGTMPAGRSAFLRSLICICVGGRPSRKGRTAVPACRRTPANLPTGSAIKSPCGPSPIRRQSVA